jgi:P-type conjugative transfer protein TrbJ
MHPPSDPDPRPRSRSPRRRSRRALALVLAAALAVEGGLAAPPAAAIIPVTDVAHIALNASWHYVHYLQFALQIYQQVEQLSGQTTQIAYQLQALRKLDSPLWRQIAGELADLDALDRSGSAIGYASPDAGGQFRQTFPGWQSWSDPDAPARQAERTLDTLRAGLATAARQGQELAAGEQQLALLRAQMGGTRGTQEALEQLTTLAVFAAQEQLLGRQALAVQIDLQAVANGYWLNREAQSRATFTLLAVESSHAAATNTSPGWSFTPAGSPLD